MRPLLQQPPQLSLSAEHILERVEPEGGAAAGEGGGGVSECWKGRADCVSATAVLQKRDISLLDLMLHSTRLSAAAAAASSAAAATFSPAYEEGEVVGGGEGGEGAGDGDAVDDVVGGERLEILFGECGALVVVGQRHLMCKARVSSLQVCARGCVWVCVHTCIY